MEAPATAPRTGLRQRKKQRTREDLVEAGIRLFLEQGYEQTTVDQIAAAVEVSQRTFFRYFATKEDLAFGAVIVAEELFYEELCRRPPQESPLTALRRAARVVHEEMRNATSTTVDSGLHLSVVRLIESTPSLLAAHLRRAEELEERVAAELARREGVDLSADLRPRLVTAVFTAACRAANRVWNSEGVPSLDAMVQLIERHLDQLQPALAGDWGRRAGALEEPPASSAPGTPATRADTTSEE